MSEVLTTTQVIERIKQFIWKRKITKVHPHHTYRPNHANFNGKNHVVLHNNMRDHHMKTLGWSDVGQNLSLFPDGLWVLGRDWNRDPASMLGNNTGAFMVEMIGDFTIGVDKLEGKQLEAIVEWSRFCLEFFKLPISLLQFHREHNATACPGTGVGKSWFNNLVQRKQVIEQMSKYFKDVPKNHWGADAADRMYEKGIVAGKGDNTLDPNAPITRIETVVLLDKAVDFIIKNLKAVK